MSDQDLATIDGKLSARRMLAWLVATWPRRFAVAMILIVPVAMTIAGGFERAPERELPVWDPDAVVSLGPYDVAPHDFFVAEELRAIPVPDDAAGWLGIRVTWTGREDDQSSFNRNLTLLPENLGIVSDIEPPNPRIVRAADRAYVGYAYPDLTDEVVWLYPVADPEAIGEELTMEYLEGRLEYSAIFQGDEWYARRDLGAVTLPRVDAPPPALIPEEEP